VRRQDPAGTGSSFPSSFESSRAGQQGSLTLARTRSTLAISDTQQQANPLAEAIRDYGIAVLSVGGAVLVRALLEPVLHGRFPLQLFAFSILVTARYGGTLPGLAATVASGLIGWYFFIPPQFSFAIRDPADTVALIVVFVVGTGISLIGGELRASLARGAAQSTALRAAALERERYLSELEAVRDSVPDALVVADPAGNRITWNPAALAAFGFGSLAEARQKFSEFIASMELSTESEGILPRERWPMARVLNGETLYRYEARARNLAQGWERTFSHSGTLARDASGKPLVAVLTLTDVTERNRADEEIRRLNADLEQRVQSRTAQLEAVNRELQTFAYSVAHDLRSPLRAIDGWSLALAEDCAAQLDEPAQQYIERVRSEAQRMGVLIDDLLQFSSITRAQLAIQTVDLSALARKVAQSFERENPERRLNFCIEPDVTSAGDPSLLEIVLTNLIGNAVKFTSTRAAAQIDFGGSRVSGETAYYVNDNGVGFDMAHADSLFQPFQRLHKVTEFPGNGIGLATAQRIVQRHGGSIWAEGELDRGARFLFTLGKPA
jgi:PAS domain S-box-containing protein